MSVGTFLCISNKMSILFEQFVMWQEATKGNLRLAPCSFLGVANVTFDTALEKELMVSWHYGAESI